MGSNTIGSHLFEIASPQGKEWPKKGAAALATWQEEGATERGYPVPLPICIRDWKIYLRLRT